MAVFRQVHPNQLNDAFEATRLVLAGLMKSIRGEFDHESSVSLLELKEATKQRPLGKVAVRDAMDSVYDEVGSLRRGITVRPSGIAFMSRKKHHERSLAVTLAQDDTDFLMEERQNIIQSLEELAARPLVHNFNWLRDKVPHISLGKIALGKADLITEEMVRPILEALPSEVRIGKGVLYSPAATSRTSPVGDLKSNTYRYHRGNTYTPLS
jgi:hypothetical protein